MLLRGVGTLRYLLILSESYMLVKCPSVQWQPDGLTIHTTEWFPGAGLLGAPPISLTSRLALEPPHRNCRVGHPGQRLSDSMPSERSCTASSAPLASTSQSSHTVRAQRTGANPWVGRCTPGNASWRSPKLQCGDSCVPIESRQPDGISDMGSRFGKKNGPDGPHVR